MTIKKLKRAIAMVLAAAMALSLAACGKNAEATKETPPVETSPEYTYTSEFLPLTGGADSALDVMLYTENGAYASCNEKVGREIPESADIDQLTEEDLTKFDIYATNIYFIGNDGSLTKLSDYKPMEGKGNEAGHTDFYSQPMLNAMALDADGNLVVVETVYTGWYDGPEGKTYLDEDYYNYYKSSQEAFVRTLDANGAELKCAPLELDPDQYMYPYIVADNDGKLVTAVSSSLVVYTGDGKVDYSIDCGYIESIFKLSDGTIYATIWDDSGLSLAPLDSASESLGKSIPLPSDAYSPIAGDDHYDIYYTSGLNFYGYDIETASAQKLFNWINCDVNSDALSKLRINSDGTVSGIVSEGNPADNTYTNMLLTVSKTPYDPAEAKETLTLACLSLASNVRDAVIKFNRGSDSARIEIKDYSEFNTADDSEAGSQKLLTEMMAGTVADIIALDGLPYRKIASKGLLEDLYPYMDADAQLQREDFFPNVLSALEVDGKLCGICPSFYVATVMGAVSVVGDKGSWSYDDFNAALAAMPEGCQPFEEGVSRKDILRACLILDMDDYVDWNTGKCSFEGEQFTELLEFASRFPAASDNESYDDAETTLDRIQSGRQMLLASSIYSLDDALYDCSYFGDQDVCYIGFPTYSGSGSMLTTESSFAMSSTCKDKDSAWQFLRSFLTEKYQENSVWSIPTNLAAYNNKLAQLMKTSYVLDENGQYVLDANGEKIKEPRYTMSSDSGPVVNIYAMTQEQADEVNSVIRSTTKFYDYDQSIISIVCDEAEAFFAGQKSAEEVAKLVQGKANIYINEQS